MEICSHFRLVISTINVIRIHELLGCDKQYNKKNKTDNSKNRKFKYCFSNNFLIFWYGYIILYYNCVENTCMLCFRFFVLFLFCFLNKIPEMFLPFFCLPQQVTIVLDKRGNVLHCST